MRINGHPDPTVFPTALAAHSLSFVAEAAAMRERALDFLAREMEPRGVWSHRPREHSAHRGLVADADDTACAAAALRDAGRALPDVARNLLAARTRDGLFRTWLITPADLMRPRALWDLFVRGTASVFDLDAVVNANVLHFLGASAETRPVVEWLLTILRERRETDCDKWYDNPFVVRYFFARALAAINEEARAIIVRRVEGSSPSSSLEHALGAGALAYCGVTSSVNALLESQLSSGSWPAAPLYNVGRVRRRGGGFVPHSADFMTWGSEELTTAFAVEALARHRTLSA